VSVLRSASAFIAILIDEQIGLGLLIENACVISIAVLPAGRREGGGECGTGDVGIGCYQRNGRNTAADESRHDDMQDVH